MPDTIPKTQEKQVYRSPDYQTSFESVDLSVQEKQNQYRFSRWWPWISDRNDFDCFVSASHPDTSYQVSNNRFLRWRPRWLSWISKQRYEKSAGSATITNRSPSQTLRGRWNRQIQTSTNHTSVRKALRLALSSPSEVIAMLKGLKKKKKKKKKKKNKKKKQTNTRTKWHKVRHKQIVS